MSDDLVKRLDNLWSMLEDEGFYTKANTTILAANRIEELETKLAKALEAIEDSFFAGFAEGRDGGWVYGDPTPAFKVYIANCDGCGWNFIIDALEQHSDGGCYCWQCYQDKLDEEEEDEEIEE